MLHNIANKHMAFQKPVFIAFCSVLFLSNCQNKDLQGASGDLSLIVNKTPTQSIVAVAKTAQKCWFKSGDPAFSKYRLAAEVNSYAGIPRFLIVPRKNPGGLPALVVQAKKKQNNAELTTFGPLLSTSEGIRINHDVKRWAFGDVSCGKKR